MSNIFAWNDFFAAVALFLVFEGILPFMRPNIWRNTMQALSSKEDKSLRAIGLLSMLTGLMLLYAVR